jgi:hypothetical protein
VILFRHLLPLIFLSAICAPAWAQTIKLPETYQTQVGQPVTVRVETDGEIVRWSPVDSGLWMSDPTLQITTKAVQVWAMKPGKYRLWAWTAKDNIPSEKAETIVVVGTPGPEPPGPTPPVPPIPPGPLPDPISKAVFDAVVKLPDPPQTISQAQAMAQVYRNVASRAAGLSTMTVEEMAQVVKTETRNAFDASARAKWVPVGEVLHNLATQHIKDRETAIDIYNKFAEGLEAVQ